MRPGRRSRSSPIRRRGRHGSGLVRRGYGRACCSDRGCATSKHGTRLLASRGAEDALKQMVHDRRMWGHLVSLTSPKCQPQRVLRGRLVRRPIQAMHDPGNAVDTKSASWHAAMGSSWRGSLLVGLRGMPSWDVVVVGAWLAAKHVRVPIDHEGVPHPGDVQVRPDL